MPGQAIVTIGERQWLVSLASTYQELVQGLGGVMSVPAGTGMLFDLGWEQIITVTTEPMLFNLDVAFLSETLVVTGIARDVPQGYLVTSTSLARYFLEINAGELTDIVAGDQASVELLAQTLAVPGWFDSIIGLTAFLMLGFFMVKVVRMFVQGALKEPDQELLPQTVIHIVCKNRFGEVEWEEKAASWKQAWKVVHDCGAEPSEVSRFGHILVIQPKRQQSEHTKLVPTEPRPRRESELEYLADSPEFLAYTIEDIGYRDKLDSAFQQAIARAKGAR